MRTYFIYKATNLINGKSYIGKTTQFKERIWQHLRMYEKEDCLFHQEIDKYGIDNFSWEVLDTTDTNEKAVELEKQYVEKYQTLKPLGYNMNKGGTGGHNSRPVVCLEFDGTFVRRYDSAMDAQRKDGYCNSDVLLCCKNILSRCRDKMFMFEDEYLQNGAKQYKQPDSHSKKRIVQCDLYGNCIKRFESVTSASEETGIARARISSALTGKTKTAGGFVFVYESDFPIKDVDKYMPSKKGRSVAQVDPITGETIEIFDRISEAGKKLNVNYKTIQKVVDIDGRTAYGYKWISQ